MKYTRFINEKMLLTNMTNDIPETSYAWMCHNLAYMRQEGKKYLASEENYKESIKSLECIDKAKIDELKHKNKYPLYWFLNDLGHLYFEWKRYDEAIEQYNKVIEGDPKNGYAQIFRGLSYYQKCNLTVAKNDFEDALIEFNCRINNMQILQDPLEDLKKSTNLFVNTSNKKALDELRGILNIIDEKFRSKQNDFEELYIFKEVLDKAGSEIGNSQVPNLDNLRKAMEALCAKFQDTLTHLNLVKASILTNIGRIEIDTGNYGLAEKKFKESNDIYVSFKNYLNLCASTTRGKEFENISALHNNIGILYYIQDRFDDAKKEFVEAIDYSKSARAYNNLGNVYYKKNDTVSATKNYLIALKIDPEQNEAKNNLGLLKDAKGKALNWWEWWFDCETWSKKIIGASLIALFVLIVVSAFVPLESAFANYALTNHGVNLQTNASFEKTISSTIPLISITPQINSGVNKSRDTILYTTTNIIKNDSSITRTEQTTETHPMKTETIKETFKREISPETKLLFAALVLFALIHPQIKGFSAGTIKFDLEPITASKGAASPQCAG